MQILRPTPPAPRARNPAGADLGVLYREHAPTVARWVARLGGPAVDVEDLVHDVFLVVQRRLREFRGDSSVTTWLYQITLNLVRNQRRKERLRRWFRRPWPAHDDQLVATGPTPVEELEHRRRLAALHKILDQMPEKHRTILVLFEIERLSGEEISTLTGTKLATVWVRLHRARAQFLERLKRFESAETP